MEITSLHFLCNNNNHDKQDGICYMHYQYIIETTTGNDGALQSIADIPRSGGAGAAPSLLAPL